jgi:LysR family transcriptional regulator for bpeEF and oprC
MDSAVDRIEAMRIFVQVVETASFSKAAKAAGVGQPAVSKRIAALERHLGGQLVRRSRTGLSVTEAGRAYYGSCVRLLAEMEAADARVADGQRSPEGRLRVAVAPGVAAVLGPALKAFIASNPQMLLDMEVSERFVSLAQDGFDLAIRVGNLPDSSLVAQRIGRVDVWTVAAPDYLRRNGAPEKPADLARHAAISFTSHGSPVPWRFRVGRTVESVTPREVLRTNDREQIRTAVLAGLGIGYIGSVTFAKDVEAGAVERLLTAFAPPSLPIHAVHAAGRRPPGKLRAFVDFAAEVFSANPLLALSARRSRT